MKRISSFLNLLILSLLGCGTAMALPVSEQNAKIAGINYLVSNEIPGAGNITDLETVYTATSGINGNTVVDYYVFNFANGHGFIMVAGDDAVRPILAYSSQSSFDRNHMAPATQYWIDGYKNQIAAVIAHNIAATDEVAAQWMALATVQKSVSARTTSSFPSSTYYLCSTTWDQDPGYDNDCPRGSSGQTVTGCVATAMAQVMKFWNWPSVGCALHSYSYSPYGVITADFSNTQYNWAEMQAHLGNNCAATDTLMFHCGVSVEMQYGTVSSAGSAATVTKSETGTLNCAEYALRAYFHYKSTISSLLRDTTVLYLGNAYFTPTGHSYIRSAWISILESELNAGRPMLYKGQEPSGDGHCWVCDGYNSTDMMHFNWGWSGASDGYYTVDNLAPPALGVGAGTGNFNTDQGIVLGIQPDSFPNVTGSLVMAAHLDCTTSSPVSYGGGITVTTKVTNSGSSNFTGSFAVQVFDTLSNLVATIQTLTGQSVAAGATSGALTFTTTGILSLVPSRYVLKLVSQPTGSSIWTAVGNSNLDYNFNMVDVRVNGLTPGMELGSAVSVTTGLSMLVGGAININTSVFNLSSTTPFSGSLQATMTNVATGTTYVVQNYTSQTIGAASMPTINFSNGHITAPAGLYALSIQYQPGGTGSYYNFGSEYFQNPVLLTVHSGAGVNNVNAANEKIQVYPNPAADIIHIAANGVNVAAVVVTDISGRIVSSQAVAQGQPIVDVSLTGCASGIYLVQIALADGTSVARKIVVSK